MKRRLIAVFLVLLALGATLGARVLTSPWLERTIREELALFARDQLGVEIRVGQLEHNFFLTRISLYDVVLADVTGAGKKDISARRMEAAIDPFSPLRGGLSFREVRLEGVSLFVERAEDGRVAVEPLLPFWEKAGGGGRSPRVDSFSILDASVAFEDRRLGVSATLSGVLITMKRRLLDPGKAMEVGFGVRGGTLSWKRIPGAVPLGIHSLQGALRYTPEEASLTHLSLAVGPFTLELGGTIPLREGSLEGTASLGFDLGELPWKTGASGRVLLKGRVLGEPAKPVFRGTLSARSLRAGTNGIEELSGDLAIDGKGAILSGAGALFRGERLRGEMALAFGFGFPMRARVIVAGYPLAGLFPGAEGRESPLGGSLDARAEITGFLDPVPGDEGIKVAAEGGGACTLFSSSATPRAFSLGAEGAYREGSFRLAVGRLRSGSLLVDATGALSSSGPRLAVTLAESDLGGASLPPSWGKGLGGALEATGTVEGSWDSPAGKVDARWSRPAWSGYRGDLAQAHLDLDGRGVRCPLASVRAGKTTVTLSGYLPWNGPGEGGKAALSLSGGRLQDVLAALDSPLRGEGEVSMTFEASSAGGTWSGKGEAGGRAVTLEGESADLVKVPFRLAGVRWTLEPSLVEKAGKALTLEGTIEDGEFALSAETRDPFPLEQVAVFKTIKAPLGGEAQVKAQAKGTLADPGNAEVDATVSSSALRYDGKSWRGAKARIGIRRKNLTAEGTLFDGRVKSRVSVGLVGDIPFRGELSGEEMTRDDLNDFFQLGLPREVNGRLSASVSAEGLLTDTQTTRVTGTVEKAGFSVAELAFTTVAPAPFTYHPPDGVSFPDLVLRTGESVLKGNVHILRAGGLEGAVKGEIDVAGFPFLAPTVTDFAGKCRIDLVAGGTVSAPRLEGYADLVDLSCVAHLPFALPCRKLSGRLEVLRDRLRFVDIRGEAEGGGLEMTGDLFFSGVNPSRGQLTWVAEGVSIAYPEGLSTRGRARITLGFAEGKGTLRGVILADEARYRNTVDLENLLGLIGEAARARVAVETPAPGEGDWLLLDLTMETVNPLDADLKILRGKANGGLRLQGTAGRPVLSGRLEVAPATIEYRGHVFEVTRGWVGFFNPRAIEPSFDIRGRTKVSGLDADGRFRDYTVDLSVTGTPAKTELTLFSDPPLGRLDIIGLLTWGSVTSRLLEKAQGMGTVGATLLLTSQLKGRIETGVERLIGFDRFIINPAQTSATGERDVWVQVDKSLGDRLFLTYSTPVGATANHEVELRYRVTDLFSILGSQKGEKEVGLDLDFSFEIP